MVYDVNPHSGSFAPEAFVTCRYYYCCASALKLDNCLYALVRERARKPLLESVQILVVKQSSTRIQNVGALLVIVK